MNSKRKPRQRPDTDWQYREGRDREGEKFCDHILVHGSGRILARVCGPVSHDECHHRVNLYCAVPSRLIKYNETLDFIDADSAKAFVDGILARFDPFAKPRPRKKPTTIQAKKTA